MKLEAQRYLLNQVGADALGGELNFGNAKPLGVPREMSVPRDIANAHVKEKDGKLLVTQGNNESIYEVGSTFNYMFLDYQSGKNFTLLKFFLINTLMFFR